ncbi:DUF4064 domain-containing protein [Terribacillus sp. 7520-G]|uniref:DUF4064 domain-containing protein n=1 Tax=Terribacillus TaxID=459532 RepID=UPI000BA5CFBB|nr:DUF4064 domain-containing protein [Terribacillus sp. 7520-G]PAD37841.1 hypothetical protein CHH53_13855 [Terribacillus sp. 7520-G]
MIKRTAELVLGIIGVAFHALAAILVGLLIAATGDVMREEMYNDPALTAEDADLISSILGGMGWYFVVVSVISAILGVVGIVLLRRDDRSTASGVIFIVTAVLSALLTLFVSFIPSILLLVAGILAIVRKPFDTNDNTIESY